MTTLEHNQTDAPTYLIVGFGVTGQALARFFEFKKWPYYVAEDGTEIVNLGPSYLGQVHLKGEDLFSNSHLINATVFKGVFPSPGVSPAHPIANWSRKNQIPVLSELEVAANNLKGELIGVTGTNGKSTTVKLIDALLKNAGYETSLNGNFGSPLVNAVSETPKDFYVVEESSYQLELIHKLRHRVSVCLNVTDDHFDRYKDIQEYAAAKARVFENSQGSDVFVYNFDDMHCNRMAKNARCKTLPFSLVNVFEEGGFTDKTDLVIRLSGSEFRFNIKECSLKGLHNLENMLASLLTALAIKNDTQAVASYKETLKTFVGLPHRVEKVHTANGVDYYDDSKGTNVGAVVMSLAGFEDDVILIAGGKDKLGDYAPLKGLVKAKVKKMILIGEAKEKMQAVFKNDTIVVLAETIREAVQIAKQSAKPGDTVLLSPACSSFDQYKNYHERGLDFQKWVKE